MAAGRRWRTLKARGPSFAVAFSPDGRFLAAGGWGAQDEGLVTVWDLRTRREVWYHRGQRWFYPVTFSPDGKLLAAGNADGTIRLWDVSALTRAGR
jgi:WD40 repeat protein